MGRRAVKNLQEILERIGSRREYLQEKFKIKEIGHNTISTSVEKLTIKHLHNNKI